MVFKSAGVLTSATPVGDAPAWTIVSRGTSVYAGLSPALFMWPPPVVSPPITKQLGGYLTQDTEHFLLGQYEPVHPVSTIASVWSRLELQLTQKSITGTVKKHLKKYFMPFLNVCRSRSSVGRALDSVLWQHTSRFQKSGVRGATGARCLSSILAGMVAVGGRP